MEFYVKLHVLLSWVNILPKMIYFNIITYFKACFEYFYFSIDQAWVCNKLLLLTLPPSAPLLPPPPPLHLVKKLLFSGLN